MAIVIMTSIVIVPAMIPAGIYLLKINNKNARRKYEPVESKQ